MAPGAGDRQAEEPARDDVDPVVDDVVDVVQEPTADRQETERGQGARVFRMREAVGGDVAIDDLGTRVGRLELGDQFGR